MLNIIWYQKNIRGKYINIQKIVPDLFRMFEKKNLVKLIKETTNGKKVINCRSNVANEVWS